MSRSLPRTSVWAAFATTIFLLVTTAATRLADHCEKLCRYRFCARQLIPQDSNRLYRENGGLAMGIPNIALGANLCLQRHEGGIIEALRNVSGGEARVSRVLSGDSFVPISEYNKSVVSPNFRKDQFKWIVNEDNGLPSVGRIHSMGNQEEHLDLLCVQMPVTSYTTFRKDGSVLRQRRPKGKSACAGFLARTVKLYIDLQWNSTSDFDLRLTEPNGFEINRFGENNRSPNGGSLTGDSGTYVCRIDLGIERIQYSPDDIVESGVYTVKVNHLRKCEPLSSYRLRVMYDGNVILDRSDVTGEVGEEIVAQTFRIP